MAKADPDGRLARFGAMLLSDREPVANVLRERIYAKLTRIATLVVLIQHGAGVSA